jgi:2-succinyl-5-enolpyruvyl-6-hydroxy-3-cyclohexene-1-carboxylate synthase
VGRNPPEDADHEKPARKLMLHQAIYNTSGLCYSLGIRDVVLSPGSRNAPLTLSFARNEKLRSWSVPDERSAGFIGLGMAQQSGKPVAICCTSGTALLNYAPAVAEAFYRELPLIVLSADRPPELIDQRDGQTIRQFDVLKNHVKASIQMPVVTDDATALEYQQALHAAVQFAQFLPKGPVHINIPFREPFYPKTGEVFSFDTYPDASVSAPEFPVWEGSLPEGKKILVLVGQQAPNAYLNEQLQIIENEAIIIRYPLNNLDVEGAAHLDLFLRDQPELRPDVLITSGLSVLSKRLKNYLRNHPPELHWHFDPAGVKVDTYLTNPTIIRGHLADWLKANPVKGNREFVNLWKAQSNRVTQALQSLLPKSAWSESFAARAVMDSLPEGSEFHLANSMPVRFADFFGVKPGVTNWCNRGTSGIDGSTSTAVGHALLSDKLNVLFSGDVAMLYDRNAFFHHHAVPNLRIVVSNNQGGGIFRLIDGPSALPELETWFETRHQRTCEYLCAESGIDYLTARNADELAQALRHFYQPSEKPRLLEIFTDPVQNVTEFRNLTRYIHET